MRKGRPSRAVLLLGSVALLQACERTVVTPVDVGGVEVVPAAITLVEGNREALTAIPRAASGEELTGRQVTWTVIHPEIASVTPEGVVEARSVGRTLVRASLGDVSGTAELTVLPLHEERGPACEISDTSISGDLRIPPDIACVLREVEVTGRLLLEAGASVTGVDVRVIGHIEGNRAAGLTLSDALVFGDLRFERGGPVSLRDSHVGGQVELKDNVGSIELRENVIERDTKVEKNRAGPFSLFGNTIDGKLECKDNDPPPTGTGNSAEDMKGQCSGL